MDRAVSRSQSTQELVDPRTARDAARDRLCPRDRHVRANMMTFSPDGSAGRCMPRPPTTWRTTRIATSRSARRRPQAGRPSPSAARRLPISVLLQITAVPAWGLQADEQARVRPTLMSILSVPIFNPEDIDGPLLGSLQVDSDLTVEEAGFNQAGVGRAAAAVRRCPVAVARRRGRAGSATSRPKPSRMAPKSRVQNASQVEPGLYVANRSTSIFQLSKTHYS